MKEHMNFMDRTALGNTLAHKLLQLRGKGAVILCLQESSLLTCLTMAKQLHAWVYPLIYAPVYTSANTHRMLLSLIHISEPTRQAEISYAVFCLKKKKT